MTKHYMNQPRHEGVGAKQPKGDQMSQIKNRFTGKVIVEGEEPLAVLVINNRTNLAGADLRDANLRGADLRDANLRGANLADANLRGASLGGTNLVDANLADANLRGASLGGTNLVDADLRGADLRYANLRGANLRGANLVDANLGGTDLAGANLGGANLVGTDLAGADLRDANLRGADLRGADLRGAYLGGTDLRGATAIIPPIMLTANWDVVSDDLCLDLMRYDASNLPKGDELFQEWADGGYCPYSSTPYQRSANFQEKSKLWSPGPAKSALELMLMLFKEKNVKFEGVE